MRLTNQDRRNFTNRVMNKIPIKSEWTHAKIVAELKRRLFKSMPKAVQDFSMKYPEQTNWTSLSVDWLNWKGDNGWHYGRVQCINGARLDNVEWEDLHALLKDRQREDDERKEMANRIYEQACCCDTLAALQKVFPDMLGLMPKETVVVKSLPVPATGLTDELVKLGLEIPQ